MVTPTEPLQGRQAACMILEDGRWYCIDPLEDALQLISKRWALLVIGILGNHDSVRFSEAKRTIPGISARAVSSVLQELQAAGLATRTVDSDHQPPAVSYSLTRSGHRLRQALIPLIKWAGDELPPSGSP